MRKWKAPVLFTLALLPVAALSGYFTVLYQFEMYDPAILETAVAQIGSMELLMVISIAQVLGYAAFCGFFGYILADRIGLMKPVRFEKAIVLRTFSFSLIGGILFSLDYWTFGAMLPGIREATAAGMTACGWIASILYGGIVEEVMLRLFMMSLIAWLIWKIFCRKREAIPAGALVAANVIAAMLFAAGHLPATAITFGTLTPVILFRCFLLNGGFGLLFGWLYQKYGIQYSMLSHALLHIISKAIWTVFI